LHRVASVLAERKQEIAASSPGRWAKRLPEADEELGYAVEDYWLATEDVMRHEGGIAVSARRGTQLDLRTPTKRVTTYVPVG
jgi:hypothetical protein